MAEYIEREALIEDINETVVFTVRKGVQLPTAEMRGANKVIDRIKSAPTADVVEVRHGEWIHSKTYYDADECNCSLCGQLMTTAKGIRKNYCPNCGAKMDGFRSDLKGESI